MKTRCRLLAASLSCALAAFPLSAVADEAATLTVEILALDANASSHGTTNVTHKIAADFQTFAGSPRNANELVNGLRNSSQITLTQRGYAPATFTPPTRPMGYGNVSTALALAQHQLALQGITQPTPEQLKIALNGGTIAANGRVVTYTGVLQMRADGMGWGEIAQQSGTKLGPLVSSLKSQNAYVSTTPAVKHHTANVAVPPVGTAANASARNSSAAGENGQREKGIVTASGGPSQTVAKGKSGRGDVSTAGGGSSGQGRGITSASNQGVQGSSQAEVNSKGVTPASNPGVTSGVGNGIGNGQGKALGHSK